ncbi:MAG: aspartyl protease family protein [Paludibacter sp.]|nr:aspartyl protease family protein [Paludibacter sp.]
MKNLHRFVLLFFLLSGICQHTRAKSVLVASVPFEMAGTYIIVQARINKTTPLNFIFDTGVRNTIITELHEEDDISLTFSERRIIQGLGQGNAVNSLRSDSNDITLGKLTLPDRTVYVLEDDIFALSENNGRKINGLLGVDLIQSYIVQIDYTRRKINFYEKTSFTPPSDYSYKPLVIENNKMYLELTLLDLNAKIRTIKMLIDTGAQLNAWFQTIRTNATEIPEKRVHARVGQGFSGEIYGYLARIPRICIEQFCITDPIVIFPDSSMIASIMKNSDRDGTIGSELLSRFNIFIDYQGKSLYFKPNLNFKSDFKYNIAGIEIKQSHESALLYEVTYVWKNSPGEKAGVQAGDLLLEINGNKSFLLNLYEIRGLFQTRSKAPLSLTVERNNDILLLNVEMEDLLRKK